MNTIPRLLLMLALACSGAVGEASGPAEMRAHELSLAVAPQGDFVAWHGGFGTGSTVYVQALDRGGRLVGLPAAVSDGRQLAYEPDLIRAGGGLVVAWYERDRETGVLSAWLSGITITGKRQWIVPLKTGDGSSRNPVVRRIGNQLHVAWIEQPVARDGGNQATVWHQRFSLSGKAEIAPRQIGLANRDTWNLNAAVTGRTFIVAYDANLDTRAHELYMLMVTDEGAERRRLSPDDGHASLYPDLQVSDDGQVAVTWFDEMDGNREVYLLTAPMRFLAKAIVPAPVRITRNDGESIGAYLAWNGQTIGLAWVDEVGGETQIFEQTFNQHGRALGPMRQLRRTRDTSGVPAIRAQDNGFLVVWNDYLLEGSGSHMRVKSSVAQIAWFPAAVPEIRSAAVQGSAAKP